MSSQNFFRLMLFLVIFFCVIFGARRLILGGAQSVNLSSAPGLSGQITQVLGAQSNSKFPTINKDYELSAQYFTDDWAIVNVQPPNSNDNSFQSSYVVMQKKSGIFQVVIGPATAIPSTQLLGLPLAVSTYLQNHVAIYTPIIGQ